VDPDETTTLSQNVRTRYPVIHVHVQEKCQVTACFTLASVANCLPVRYVLRSKDMEITGYEIRTVGRTVHNVPAIVPRPVTCLVCSVGCSDFHLCGPLLKHEGGKMPT
jgi:hypothetical protein